MARTAGKSAATTPTRSRRQSAGTAPRTNGPGGDGKLIYTFPEGNAGMRRLLGGKGAGLAEMTNAGLPVPPGFTITTEACNAYYAAGRELPEGLWDDIRSHMTELEQETGKGFGDADNPLLVSVRSGAAFSMPGMMDTVLNLGLNPDTVAGIIRLTGNERFGYDAWRRFVAMFGRIVLDIEAAAFDEPLEELKEKRHAKADTDLSAEDLRALADRYQEIVQKRTGEPFPTDPVQAARARRARRLRQLVRQAGARLSRVQQDPARSGHSGEHRDHGLREHGLGLRHRGGLHSRPQYRREGHLRGVPDERSGRGRCGGHPDAGQDQPDAR